MARCTWDDGRGNWGIKGVELAQLPPNAYGALYKLHDMERLAEDIKLETNPQFVSFWMKELLGMLELPGDVYGKA